MNKPKKGKFIMIDGMDGIGKGTLINSLTRKASKDNLKIFDLNKYWEENDSLPDLSELNDIDILITSEPTFYGVGKQIRNFLISKENKINFSTSLIAQAYSLDRHILYEALLIPALNKGLTIIQSRGVSTSLVYQKITTKDKTFSFEEILNLPGNKFALENSPDFLLILTAKDTEIILERLKNRIKDDNCIFEKLDFQSKVKEAYESNKFSQIFTERGTKIHYIDAGNSKEESIKQIEDFYDTYLK